MTIITTECAHCGRKIKFDAALLMPERPLVRCPVCKTVSNVAKALEKQAAPLPQEVGWLVVHDEQTPEQTLSLKPGKNIVGRASESKPADVPIRTEDRYMSRNHCVLEVSQLPSGQWEYLLSDIGSTNGTFLNGKPNSRLREQMQVVLTDGDTIQIGRTKVVLKTIQQAGNAQNARQTVLLSGYTPTIIV